MNNGICPYCNEEINSSAIMCNKCGCKITLASIPKSKRVAVQEAYKENPLWIILQLALAFGGLFVMWQFSFILGLIVFACSFLIAIPINKIWLRLCLENEFRIKLQRERQKEQSAKKDDEAVKIEVCEKENSQIEQ